MFVFITGVSALMGITSNGNYCIETISISNIITVVQKSFIDAIADSWTT